MSKTTFGKPEVGDQFDCKRIGTEISYRGFKLDESSAAVIEAKHFQKFHMWEFWCIFPEREITLIKRSCTCSEKASAENT